jgi:hypothetical protein
MRTCDTEDNMPFFPTTILEGLAAGTLSCILLRVTKADLFSDQFRAHMLVTEWHGGLEAEYISSLIAEVEKEIPISREDLLSKLRWIDVRLG